MLTMHGDYLIRLTSDMKRHFKSGLIFKPEYLLLRTKYWYIFSIFKCSHPTLPGSPAPCYIFMVTAPRNGYKMKRRTRFLLAFFWFFSLITICCLGYFLIPSLVCVCARAPCGSIYCTNRMPSIGKAPQDDICFFSLRAFFRTFFTQ